MRNLLTASLGILLLCSNAFPQGKCQCRKTELNAVRGHETITLINQVQFGRIQGVIKDPAEAAISNAIVDLYAEPNRTKRIAACQVGEDGKFCFAGLRPGRYRLFFGAAGFNSMEIYVTLKPRKSGQSGRKLEVILPVGT